MPSLTLAGQNRRLIAERYVRSTMPVFWTDLSRHDGLIFPSDDAYGHQVTVTGATWGNQGSIFDGTDDFISVPDAPSLSSLGTTGVTIISRFKTATNVRGVICKDSGVLGEREWLIRPTATGTLVMFFSNTNSYLEVDGTANPIDNIWHQVAVTWNGVNATGNINLYMNGVLEALTLDLKSGAGATPYDGVAAVEIGRFAGGNYFNGTIAECLIYNRVLTRTEIQRIYLATNWRYQ